MSCHKFNQLKSRAGFSSLLLAGASLLLAVNHVQGQEALRISMAGDLAASMRQQAMSSIGYYNLLLGPTAWKFSSGLGVSYNDNVRLQPKAESDVIFRPNLDTQMHWPVSLKNSFDVSLGAGYSAYVQHSDLSQFFLTPGTGLSFDVYLGDFKINLHDRATITQNTYENPGTSGNNRNLVSLENALGTSVLWDLDETVFNLGYDHVNYVALSSGQGGQPNAASENLSANAALRLRPELLVGLEAGGTLINYSRRDASIPLVVPGAVQWNAGFFGSAQITDYISARLDAGYTVYTPDNTATNLVTSGSSGLYFSLSLSHRVNQWVNYTLSAGRSTDLSAYGQAQSYYTVRVDPNWILFKKFSLSTPFWWREASLAYNSTAYQNQNYDQFGLGASLGRSLSQKLTGTISYQWIKETSDQANLNYTVNIVSLNFTYRF